MSDDLDLLQLSQASERFRRAHLQALLSDWLARITGRNPNLLNYEEVRVILEAREGVTQLRTQDVPLERIVGSVGRYRDFNQAFLPRNEALAERWSRVDAAMNAAPGVPPVELYQVGDVYFVRDGNHRVSVARSRGDKTIEAYVTNVDVPFPVEADSAEELSKWLVEAGHRLFLSRTRLQELIPDADIILTAPGRYRQLYEHIDVHRWYMGEAQNREIPYDEAVVSWYQNIYLPLAEAIRQNNILKQFPGRTEADLYLWISQHRAELNEQYDLNLSDKAAVSTFASAYSERPLSKAFKNARMAMARIAAGDSVIVGLPETGQIDEASQPELAATG